MKYVRFLRLAAVLTLLAGVSATIITAEDAQPKKLVTPVPRQDAGWLQRHEAMNARVKQGNVDLLFIGDSITHSWEGAGKKVWDKYYGRRNAVNLGIGGDRVEHVLWRLEHGNIDGIAPKLAVLMIGTNNSGGRPDSKNAEVIIEGTKMIVERLRAKLPNTKILVLAIFPRGANNEDRLRRAGQKSNEAVSKLADDKTVFYLDINAKFLEADGTLSKDIMPDLLHPNAKGYAIWAEAIEPTVAKLMGEK